MAKGGRKSTRKPAKRAPRSPAASSKPRVYPNATLGPDASLEQTGVFPYRDSTSADEPEEEIPESTPQSFAGLADKRLFSGKHRIPVSQILQLLVLAAVLVVFVSDSIEGRLSRWEDIWWTIQKSAVLAGLVALLAIVLGRLRSDREVGGVAARRIPPMTNTKPTEVDKAEIVGLHTEMVDRAKHEGIMIWTRFSAYFVVISAMGYGWAQVTGSVSTDAASSSVQIIVGLAGLLTAHAWVLTMINGAYWQEFFNEELKGFEIKHKDFLPQYYVDIATSEGKHQRPDLIYVSIALTLAVAVGWWYLIISSEILPLWVPIVAVVGLILLALIIEEVFRRRPPKTPMGTAS